jgi:hypothetical protein
MCGLWGARVASSARVTRVETPRGVEDGSGSERAGHGAPGCFNRSRRGMGAGRRRMKTAVLGATNPGGGPWEPKAAPFGSQAPRFHVEHPVIGRWRERWAPACTDTRPNRKGGRSTTAPGESPEQRAQAHGGAARVQAANDGSLPRNASADTQIPAGAGLCHSLQLSEPGHRHPKTR